MKGAMTKWYQLRWEAGLEIERKFWIKWVEQSGMEWKDDFAKRLDPMFSADELISGLISEEVTIPVVLDAGSGPLSAFPKILHDGRKVQLHAIDFLAKPFAISLKEVAIKPLVEIREGNVEQLEEIFPDSTFDMIFMRNTLDHLADPCAALESMLTVLKPGGCIFLAHRKNLGARENYEGSAIWNIDLQNGQLTIWSKGHSINVQEALHDYLNIESIASDDWIDVVMRKKK